MAQDPGAESPRNNPLLTPDVVPAFSRLDAAAIVPTARTLIKEQDAALARFEATCTPTWEGGVAPLSELAEPLSYAWKLVHHLLGVKNSEALRNAEHEVQGDVIAAGLRLSQSRPAYAAMVALRDGPQWKSLEESQRRIVTSAILSAEQAGIALEGAAAERFLSIETELGELQTKFSNHLLDATKAFAMVLGTKDDVAGLPPSLLAAAAQSARAAAAGDATMGAATPDAGPWRITLDAPVYVPFMEHSQRPELRERLYRAFITRASAGGLDNQPILQRILDLRQEKARLLGYPHYAALSLSRKMAKDVTAVSRLLDELRGTARPRALGELRDLIAFARAETGNPTLELALWDVPFWAERMRETLFSFTEEELRPYFPLPRVLEGLFGVAHRLFGVQVVAADGEAPVWHADVRFFKVLGEDAQPVAYFFLDPYSRPEEKRGGAWMDVCLDRKKRPDGSLRLPIAYLVCNGSPPVDGQPSLLTFREAETLFHEFGHGLQHMLTRVDHVDAAGINNVEWDAVELPSQFMENWCYHRPTLMGFARHFETGQPLPADLFDKIAAARTFRAGSHFLRQIHFATLDLELHHRFDPGAAGNVQDFVARVSADNTTLPPLPEDRFLCGFSHIFAGGYAAGYYSYKWAEVLAADAFAAFKEAGLDDQARLAEVGRRFRDTVLSMGGGADPAEVFRAFRGRDPDPQALLRAYGLAA
jgi:oligopeptidase A